LTNEEKKTTQKKLREVAREKRARGRGCRKIQINGEWFI
jgi:hypothetical protein